MQVIGPALREIIAGALPGQQAPAWLVMDEMRRLLDSSEPPRVRRLWSVPPGRCAQRMMCGTIGSTSFRPGRVAAAPRFSTWPRR